MSLTSPRKARVIGTVTNQTIEVLQLSIAESTAVTNATDAAATVSVGDAGGDTIETYDVPLEIRDNETQETTTGQLIADIPFQDNAVEITIKTPIPDGKGSVRTTVVPSTRSLRDIIDRIPDRAFVPDAKGARRSLSNRLDTAERHVTERRYRPAVNVLKSIRDTLGEVLRDDYTVRDAREPTKEQVLDTVEREIKRLSEFVSTPESGNEGGNGNGNRKGQNK